MTSWAEAVTRAIRRHVAETGSAQFTRQAFIEAELSAIVGDTGTDGITPAQTLGRELQQLRNTGLLMFVDRGTYRWLGDMPERVEQRPTSAVFVLTGRADRLLKPEQGFVLPAHWQRTARRTVGRWIVYQGREGYGATARVDEIVAEPDRSGFLRASMRQGSYLEFGRTVPLVVQDRVLEQALADPHGQLNVGRAAQPIRAISDDTFNRIYDLAVDESADILPRDAAEDDVYASLKEERSAWEGPVDRARMLVERTVRDRQFRIRVLAAYGARCALTGFGLRNGGGRAETQAAHIKSVKANGPDSLTNGIALSGTMHWMFDRGLVSLSDAGDILLSRAINDRESVERLVFPDRKARLPKDAAHRPDPEYLHWHRTECFHH